MQHDGGGVKGLMETLTISTEALHINWTFFCPEMQHRQFVQQSGFIKWVLLRQA